MDFDVSKENIQPLRGGRNVQQLGMALQAQTNRELQLQLMQQKEEFENLIRTYDGDDPLENYYNYISWVEQSYPKHGHEGNLVPLLEHCLRLFENDKRYTHDRRFCKLWIKYFDLQQNPLELYHMMKAKGLCINCADLYKAWAYYYEATGDFQAAYNVFEEGKRNLAQPYEELDAAHKSLVMAAGHHMLFGSDEHQLLEKRQALTALHTFRPGRVSNVRVPSANGIVTVPSNSTTSKSNAAVFVYEDRGMEPVELGAKQRPLSLITVAKRQEMPKENTLKPGPWTTVPVKKRVIGVKNSLGFTVHEDVDIVEGIRLPKNHVKECYEDYSDWHVSIKYPEPPNPAMIPMYPKHRVYIDPNTEYSIDELRATRYRQIPVCPQLPQVEQEILQDVELMQESLSELRNDIFQRSLLNHSQQNDFLRPTKQDPQTSYVDQAVQSSSYVVTQTPSKQSLDPVQGSNRQTAFLDLTKQDDVPHTSWGKGATSNTFNLWCSPTPPRPPPATTNFFVYEQTMQEIPPQVPPKGSAMKTAFKVLNADELAETGSRGGMDIAVTAQAADSAKPMPLFSDSSSSSFEDIVNQDRQDVMNCSNTQMFNFNLNVMQVSTPFKETVLSSNLSEEETVASRKQLFTEPKYQEKDTALSTILEETKSYGSSSSSGGGTTKSAVFNNNTNKMGTILEEHNSYLAQNLMANAALRSSLLGNYVDLGPSTAVAVPEDASVKPISPLEENEVSMPLASPIRTIPAPADVIPLETAPSDPFKASFINQLLERICFPGPHTYGYIEIPFTPKISLKKEPVLIGGDNYIVDKQLGKGTYGTVFRALDIRRNKTVALKLQKPANKWEFYICREIQSRLISHPLRDRFMDVTLGYFNDQTSILVSDFMPGGSLLDLANLHKQKAGKLKEALVIYFSLQMLQIVQALHDIRIIHADIKPDNFLVFVFPDNTVGLQLIDFGCSIDMSLLPPNTSFTRRVTTEDFVCCEMLDGIPWNYHTDMFCIAATTHVLLFDTYIKLKKQDDVWSIASRFARYYKVDFWNMFFSALLNQHNGPADSSTLQLLLEEALAILNKDSSTALASQMRVAVNLLKNR